jgi:geranylgeranyl reductase
VFYDSLLFRSWYAWIFPHGKYVSIGCGCELGLTTGHKLRTNFNKWLKKNKIDVTNGEFRGFYVNPDHQGYRYGNIFLAGDAAGLASGLTGEGIYQALVSGDEVAELILDNSYVPRRLNALIGSNRGHARVIDVLENSGIARNVLYEIIALSFRSGYLREKALRKIF